MPDPVREHPFNSRTNWVFPGISSRKLHRLPLPGPETGSKARLGGDGNSWDPNNVRFAPKADTRARD